MTLSWLNLRHHVVPDLIKDGWVCWDRVELVPRRNLHKEILPKPASKRQVQKEENGSKRKKPLK